MSNDEHPVNATVNGRDVTLTDDPSTMLVHALRDQLGLAGVRTGCGVGECGVCTVLVDGASVRSCSTPLSDVAGHTVLTPEGLGGPDDPHPVQQAFIDCQAAQCGYCVNGMTMTVASLAERRPTSDELVRALDEHLCRCGTHVRLLEAARRAVGLTPGTVPPDGLATARSGPDHADPAGTTTLPSAVLAHPRVEQWLELADDGRVVAHAGKAELGQGIRTAFAQIVAAQLGIPVGRVEVRSPRTGDSPDQRFTAGSMSIEDGGTAFAHAAAAFRRLLLDEAARTLSCDRALLSVTADGVTLPDGPAIGFADLAARGVQGVIHETDVPRWDVGTIGQAVARTDLPRKVTGAAAYLHDMVLPGMLHARAVLPPTPGARLVTAHLDGARDLPGVVEVVRDGRLVLVLAERVVQAERAVQRLARDLTWDEVPVEVPADLAATMRAAPAEPFSAREDSDVGEALARSRVRRATYETPYQAHGSMAPAAAIARVDDDRVHVWAHVQGVYPLQRELATLLGLAPEDVTVEHVDGPGSYGMNGADDAAALAVVAARACPGRPVRFQFSIQDEFGWEPYGPAMLVDLEAGVDDDGQMTAWRHRARTDAHMARPNGDGDRLLVAWLREDAVERPWPGAGEGGVRNGVPLYDVPAVSAVADHVQGPLRTAALRCLGAYTNIFATESFLDELAELAGADPVEFRLAHLTDARARAVLEAAADRAGWQHRIGPSGRGMGVALAHYKDSKAYVAQVAEVEVDPARGDLRVTRIVVTCDAGRVVNPDGACNQLEGGTLQGLSRTLFERVDVGPSGARQRDWTTYDVLRFRHVPEVQVHLLDQPDAPPLGVGESSTPVVPAVIANAIDDAIGIRLRRLPLTGAQMQQRLLEMDEDEARRVRV